MRSTLPVQDSVFSAASMKHSRHVNAAAGLKASFTRAMESLNLNSRKAPQKMSQKVLQQQPQQQAQKLPGKVYRAPVYSQHASRAGDTEEEVQQQCIDWHAQQRGPLVCTNDSGKQP